MKYVPAWLKPLVEAAQHWQADDASLMAAAVSYYAALSIFPLLLVLIACMGWVIQSTSMGLDAETQILQSVSNYASPSVSDSVAQMLQHVKTNAVVGGPLGLLGLMIGAATLFAQFERAFDKIWEIPVGESGGWLSAVKNFLVNRGKAFLMLLCVGFLLLLNLIAGVVLGYVQSFAEGVIPGFEWVWKGLGIALGLVVSTLAFGLLFWQLPKVEIRWKEALRGGVVTAIAWSLGQWVLTAILVGDRFSAYGLIGSFIAVLVWIYYAACVVFLGAEYVQVICRDCNPRENAEATRAA